MSSKTTKSATDDKKILNLLNEIMSKVDKLDLVIENQNLMREKLFDLHCKVDFNGSINMATSNTKTVKNVSSTDTKAKSMNIMEFFKKEYKTSIQEPGSEFSQEVIDQAKTNINKIVSDSAINELFEKFSSDIKAKSKKKDVLEKYKASLIYKEIIKPDATKVKLLKNIKIKEESNNLIVSPEITENVLSPTNTKSDSEEESEEEDFN